MRYQCARCGAATDSRTLCAQCEPWWREPGLPEERAASVEFAANWLRDLLLEHNGRMCVADVYDLARRLNGPNTPLNGLLAAERQLAANGICCREPGPYLTEDLVFPIQEQMAHGDLLRTLLGIREDLTEKEQHG